MVFCTCVSAGAGPPAKGLPDSPPPARDAAGFARALALVAARHPAVDVEPLAALRAVRVDLVAGPRLERDARPKTLELRRFGRFLDASYPPETLICAQAPGERARLAASLAPLFALRMSGPDAKESESAA